MFMGSERHDTEVAPGSRGSQTVIRCEVMYLLQLRPRILPVLFPADVLTGQIFLHAAFTLLSPLQRAQPLPSPLCLVSLIMESSN